MVRDPYWLHAYWELGRTGVERAQAALGQEWHSVRPILRLVEVTEGGTTSAVETPVRDIDIHGGVNNWYVDVQDPPKSYRIDIGYLAAERQVLRAWLAATSSRRRRPATTNGSTKTGATSPATSNASTRKAAVTTATATAAIELQEVFEERLRRPMGASLISRCGPGVDGLLGDASRLPFRDRRRVDRLRQDRSPMPA